jgi:membrane associated rhomboid family serine protease
MLLCTVVFVAQWADGGGLALIRAFGFVPAAVLGGSPGPAGPIAPLATSVTYMFLHAGWLHLIGNLLFLWIFVGYVEEQMGHAGFVLFFVLSGMVAAFAQGIPDAESVMPVVGASGGVSGVLGAYLLLQPRAEVSVAVPIFIVVQIVRLPAWVVLAFWFAFQLLYELSPESSASTVAFRAHLGGFVAGAVLSPLFAPRLRGRHAA